jgi:hypothetical protein
MIIWLIFLGVSVVLLGVTVLFLERRVARLERQIKALKRTQSRPSGTRKKRTKKTVMQRLGF